MGVIRFDGDDQLRWTTIAAALGNIITDAWTVGFLAKRASAGSQFRALGYLLQGGNVYPGASFTTANLLTVDIAGSAPVTAATYASTASPYMLIFSKANSTAPVILEWKLGSGGSWTQETLTPDMGEPASAADTLEIGTWKNGSDRFNGWIGLVAYWAGAMSQANKQALDDNWRTSDWYNSAHGTPVFLAELNVAGASVVDILGNATTLGVTGTVLDSGETLDSWNFNGTGAGGGPTLIAAPDPIGAGISDTSSPIKALITATEAGALALIDAALAVGAALVATDTSATVLADESPATHAALRAAEAFALSVDDAAQVLAFVAAVEALPLVLQEQVVARAVVLAADALGINLDDVGAQQESSAFAFIVAADTGAVELTDAGTALVARLGAQDALAVILADLAVAAIALRASDSFAVVLGPTLPILAQIVASDLAALALADAGTSTILGPPVIKVAQDALVALLADLAGLSIELVVGGTDEQIQFTEQIQTLSTGIFGADTVEPKLAESGLVQILRQLISATDDLPVSLAEIANLFARLASTEEVSPNVIDVALSLAAMFRAADQAGLALEDVGVIFVDALVSILAADTTVVEAVELAASITITLVAIASADDASVSLDDRAAIDVLSLAMTATDALTVGADDAAQFQITFALLLAGDEATVALNDLATILVLQGLIPISALDGAALVIGDSAISTIIETLLDIRSDDTMAFVAVDGSQPVLALLREADAVEIAAFDLGNATVIINRLPGNILVATVTYLSPVRTAELVQ